jgi:ferredoxin
MPKNSSLAESLTDLPEMETWTLQPKPITLRLSVSLDNNHCHRFAICQQEAPAVFQLTADGRLEYDRTPDASQHRAVFQAARLCPMQAIHIDQSDEGAQS